MIGLGFRFCSVVLGWTGTEHWLGVELGLAGLGWSSDLFRDLIFFHIWLG